MEQEDNNNNNRGANVPPDHGAMMAVVSGDSDNNDEEDIFETSDARDDETVDSSTPQQGDGFLYDENLDDEDERYVYHNLRGGKHEAKNKGDTSGKIPAVQKPRNSDAVLACPCCFNILSLDTQRHYKYQNQYRAMFVMGIGVDWQHLLKYDSEAKGLVRYHPPGSNNPPPAAAAASAQGSPIVAPDQPFASSSSSDNENDPIYYSVHCAGCQTQVGALDMADEVYHFYDCLASA